MSRLWRHAISALGTPGLIALAVIAACLGISSRMLLPLEQMEADLDARLERARPLPMKQRAKAERVAGDLGSFYAFFEGDRTTTDRLATLYAIGKSAGIVVRTAEYKVIESQKRIERYQISIPVTGKYQQVRAFIEGALSEIAVLSVDQVRMRKTRALDGVVEAELIFSLYEARK